MKPATCSCRVTTSLMREVRSASRKSRFSSPGAPKMHSTPSFSSARTIRSAPFTVDGCMAHASFGGLPGMRESRGRAGRAKSDLRGLLSSRAECYVLGLLAGPGDHGDDDCGHAGDQRQPDRVV